MDKQTLLVLFGGVSSEHAVSLRSARSILDQLDSERYEILKLGITRRGSWLLYRGDNEAIAADTWSQGDVTPAFLSPDRAVHGLLLLEGQTARTVRVDAVFPVLHGKNGEDGTVQGLCALADIPCVGCGVLASAACMDKEFTHAMLTQAGIQNARFLCVRAGEADGLEAVLARMECAGIRFPVFVKPANAGSSVGITKAHDAGELPAALKTALREDAKALIEETIDGIEVECAVLGGDTPIAADVIGEIEPLRELYDYEGKYCDDTTALHIPARVPEETARLVRETACRAWRALGCRGLARVDFFVRRRDGAVILNEINTLPGFTSISMYPKLFCHGGRTYAALLDMLIACALGEDPNEFVLERPGR